MKTIIVIVTNAIAIVLIIIIILFILLHVRFRLSDMPLRKQVKCHTPNDNHTSACFV